MLQGKGLYFSLLIIILAILSARYNLPFYLGFIGFLGLFFWKNGGDFVVWGGICFFIGFFVFMQNQLDVTDNKTSAKVVLLDFPEKMQPIGTRLLVKVQKNHYLAGKKLLLRDFKNNNWQIDHWYEVEINKLKKSPVGAQFVASGQIVAILHQGKNNSFAGKLASFRLMLKNRIDQIYSPNSASFARALLLGERQAINNKQKQNLIKTGTIHLLAISGLHIALVAGFVYLIFKYLASYTRIANIIEPHSLALFFAVIFAGLYLLISGNKPPAMRAFLMFLGLVLYWFLPRLQSGLNGLIWAGLIMLLIDPNLLFNQSAWLSFLATFVVLLVCHNFRHYSAIILWLLLQLFLTLSLLLLSWAWFGGISLVGFLVNLLVVPWIGVLLGGFWLGLLFPFLSSVIEFIFNVINQTINFFANFSISYLIFNWQPNSLQAIIWYGLVLILITKLFKKVKLFLAGILFICLFVFRSKTNQEIITTPNKRAMILYQNNQVVIINSAYKFRDRDDNEKYILPFLRKIGKKPDAIILTNKNSANLSGLQTLLKYYPDTPIYSVIPIIDLPFKYHYCPDISLTNNISFAKNRYCVANFFNWQISNKEVKKIN